MIAAASRVVDVTMGRYVLRHADRVLGVSEQAADFASRLGGVRADVFYNAITPPCSRPEPIADRHRHLVFVGRMVPGKGWDTFIEAVARLSAEGVEVTGELLGAGADLEAARALIADRNLADRLCAPGRVSAQEVRSRLAGATLVNPTVLSEGFQTTLLEALAERGRVVTFTVPGAKLLAEQGHPVVITKERNVESLVDSLRGAPPSPIASPASHLLLPEERSCRRTRPPRLPRTHPRSRPRRRPPPPRLPHRRRRRRRRSPHRSPHA